MKNKKWFIIGLSILFIILTILVKMNLTTSIDNYIYKIITFRINDNLTNIYKIITFFGSTLFIVSLCVIFFILFIYYKKKNYSFIISGVLIISTIINNLIKIIIQRERPEVLQLVTESSYSYPSGHSMASVSMYGILLYLVIKSKWNKKIKIPLIILLSILPILVGISRIYLGAHFVTDVIGAFIVSIIFILIEVYFIEKNEWL